MSRWFGPATQNGIVVADLDAALAHWTGALGVGPFFRFDQLPHEAYAEHGVAQGAPDIAIALAQWGELQIELIHPRGVGDTTWHRCLRQRGGGLHHVSVWTPDFDATMRRGREAGQRVEVEGRLAGGLRYAYFERAAADAPQLEVSELTEAAAGLYALVRQCAQGWDGRDPVRRL